jgi:hypothetical protein
MSTVAEIKAALPRLSAEDLIVIEGELHQLQRKASGGVIFDDDYGVWTEEDQASVAAEAWEMLDGKPAKS